MDKTSREKFHDIEVNDNLVYLDNNGCRCQGVISGWINHKGDPAPLVGPRGERIVPLSQVLSRTRHGATREWSEQK